jgi:hypothetical protein
MLQTGTRTVMRSTFDREGGNEAADASHFVRQARAPEQTGGVDLVPLSLEGQGVLSFFRTNHWHGSPWRFTVDGRSTLVSESSTATPDAPVIDSTFLPPDPFRAPLAFTWSTTRGADLSWVPVPFTTSLELGYGRSHYGTGYYIVRLVPEGSRDVTPPSASWDPNGAAPADVLALLATPAPELAPRALPSVTGRISLDAPGSGTSRATLATLAGPGSIRALSLRAPRASAVALGRATLRITWEDRATPSIETPVSLFFGAGTFYRRDDREWLVKALPVSVRFPPGEDAIEATTVLPMPYRRAAKIELVATEPVRDVQFDIRHSATTPDEPSGWLHATYRDHAAPERGRDLVLLDTRGIEGEDAWCGTVVGTSIVFSDRARLDTLEGDPRFFFDGSDTPQVQGTGTEEWGGGGDYWGGELMTLPLAGHPTGARSPAEQKEPEDGIESLYRFLLSDVMPFGAHARLQLEHGGGDESEEHYRTTSFWYGSPRACLVETDRVRVGDVEDERMHQWSATGVTELRTVTSRHEVGVARAGAVETVPLTTEIGRVVRGEAEVSLAIDPENVGVLLRRKLDLDVPEQRAEVFVADASEPSSARALRWKRAGSWYVAGGARHLYANAATETGAVAPDVRVSSRRFRDDELLVDRRFTEGRTRLRFRFVAVATGKPLLPSEPAPAAAFSVFRLSAWAWKRPTGL